MKKIFSILAIATLIGCSTDDEPVVQQQPKPQPPVIKNCKCDVTFKNTLNNGIFTVKDIIVVCGKSAFDTLNFYYNEGEFISEECYPID